MTLAVVLAVAGAQMITWIAVRNRLLSEALIEVIHSSPSTEQRFKCAVLSADLLSDIDPALGRITEEAGEVGLKLGSEQQLSEDRGVDLSDCSTIAGEIDWNTPFLARVTLQQWHPRFDSNGFHAYLTPFLGRWILLDTKQAWS